MTPPPRVVITGAGAVTPAGLSAEAIARRLRAETSLFAPPTTFDASGFAEPRAAEVREFDPAPYFRLPKAIKLAHRTTRFAVAASVLALGSAGWPAALARDRLGVLLGTSGCDPQVDELARALAADPGARTATDISAFADCVLEGLNPLWLLIGLPNMPSSHVAIQCDARGPNSTIMTDGIAGLQAIGEAAQWIASGEADAVLAGGADSALHPYAYASYEQAGLLRSGGNGSFVPGEGAGVLLLESLSHARERHAPIKGEVVAFAAGTCLRETMCRTRERLGRRAAPPALATFNGLQAAGAGVESCRSDLAAVFGAGTRRIPCLDVTARLGHALAAAGAIDAALTIGALAGAGDLVLCNSLGYGGQAATLALAVGGDAGDQEMACPLADRNSRRA